MMHSANGSGLGFARVSSFSRVSNPALLTGYCSAVSNAQPSQQCSSPLPLHLNSFAAVQAAEADEAAADVSVVPEILETAQATNALPATYSPPPQNSVCKNILLRRRISPEQTCSTPDGGMKADIARSGIFSEQFEVTGRLSDVVNDYPHLDYDERGQDSESSCDEDELKHDRADGVFRSASGTASRRDAMYLLRYTVERFVHLVAMTAPSEVRKSGSMQKYQSFVFVAVSCYMCAIPALLFAFYGLPHSYLLARAAAFSLLVAPLTSRFTKSLNITVCLFSAASLLYLMSTACYHGPVILVWTSIIPLVAFNAFSTRGVLASSAAVAAVVCIAGTLDRNGSKSLASRTLPSNVVRLLAPEGLSSSNVEPCLPTVVIAVWLLFLGVVGVVQSVVYTRVAEPAKC